MVSTGGKINTTGLGSGTQGLLKVNKINAISTNPIVLISLLSMW